MNEEPEKNGLTNELQVINPGLYQFKCWRRMQKDEFITKIDTVYQNYDKTKVD